MYFAIQFSVLNTYQSADVIAGKAKSKSNVNRTPGYTRGRHVRQEFKPLERSMRRERPVTVALLGLIFN